jgi:PAS domain S-box-containing protein
VIRVPVTPGRGHIPMSENRLVTRLQASSAIVGTAVGLLGGLVLLGWAFDIVPLKRVVPGSPPMTVDTAVAFTLSAIPLVVRRNQAIRPLAVARVGAALVAVSGALALAGYALDWNLRGDMAATSQPGRMAPMTALGFVLIGLAELVLDHPRAGAPGQWLAVAAGCLGVFNLVGFTYQVQGLGHLHSPASAYTEMAAHTAGAFVAISSAVLCARPDHGMMAVVTSPSAGGMVARRLLPATLGVPFVLGWLRLLGERAGLWGFRAGWGVFGVATVVVFLVIVWLSARVLHRTDTRRQQVEAALSRARDGLESQVKHRTQTLSETVQALRVEVDERQRGEQALRDGERRYRDLVDSSLGLICIHDLEGTLLSVNPAAARLLGYTGAELVGTKLYEVLAPSVRHEFSQYLERIRRAPTDEGVMRVVTRDGQERLWAYSNVRYEEPGRPPYVLGHAQDITALKRAEHLARQAEALRSVAHLANAAAHEINNPLAIVAGHLDMLKDAHASDHEALERIEKARTAVERIRAIVVSMARITRLERRGWAPDLPPLLDLHRSAEPAADNASTPDRASES